MNKKNETQHLSSVVNLARALLWLCALSTPAIAQLGAPVGLPIEIELITGNTACNSVEYALGSYWIGAGPSIPGGPDKIYEVSTSGALLSTTDGCMPPVMTGATDFAADEDAQLLCVAKGTWHCVYSRTPVGQQCVWVQSIAYATGALARDPASGHYFATWGTAPLTKFTIDPITFAHTVVNTLPSSGKFVRGLSWDEVNGTLWAFCAENPIPGPNNKVEFNEIDPTSGQLTGQSFMGDTTLAAPNLAGGCDIFHDVRNPGFLSIVGVHRSAPDKLMTYSLAVPFACTGYPVDYCSAKTNSLGCVPAIVSTGAPSATAGAGFIVQGTNVRNNKSGILFYGVNGRNGAPFSGGTLCVAPPVKRTANILSGGSQPPLNDCTGVYTLDMNVFAVSPGPPVPLSALQVPGTRVNCQFWGRDPGFPAPNNTTLTNALEYVICP